MAVPAEYTIQNISFAKFFYGVLASMSLLMGGFERYDRSRDLFRDRYVHTDNKFEFIIIGGGTSGSILANRLSKDHKVLLLEAYGDPFSLQNIPGWTQYMIKHKEVNWLHQVVPQKKACLAVENQQPMINAGKGLGGSSNLGFLNFLRGCPSDYDSIAEITGDKSWTYENVLPYFKKFEDYGGPWLDSDLHGFEGDLRLERPNFTGLADNFVRASVEIGVPYTDLNGRFSEGSDVILSPLRRGYRQSTFTAFIQNIRPRGNLIIRKFAHVNKILFNEDNMTYAVVYDRHNEKNIEAYARKEIILSAGAINSPQLLMLSGVGPREQLEKFGIKVVKDSPNVGKGLKDQLVTFLGPFLTEKGMSFLIDRDLTPQNVAKFGMAGGQGPLTSSGYQANTLIKSSKRVKSPNIQLTLSGLGQHLNFQKEFSEMYHLKLDGMLKDYLDDSMGKDGFTILIYNTQPKSYGEVTLRSIDPYDKMIIDPKFLNDDSDLHAMVDGINKALQIAENTKAITKELNATFTKQMFPKFPASHVTSSCAMGRKGSNSVVDSEFKVNGVRRLRVVDASIFAKPLCSSPEAGVMMSAEKAADIILRFWSSMSQSKMV